MSTVAQVRPPEAGHSRRLTLAGRQALTGYLLVLPALMLLTLLVAYPFFFAIAISFTDRMVGQAGQWIGLDNFRYLANNPSFIKTIQNTIIMVVVSDILKLVIGLGLAMLLHQQVAGRGLMRAVKRTRPEMHDASRYRARIIGRPRHHRRQRIERRKGQSVHSVTPRFQIAISRSPLRSAAVGSPEAIATMRASNASAASSIPASNTIPASKSIHPGLRAARSLFDAIFTVGAGKPSGVPRPVVNRITPAPAAASAVDDTASFPGASSSVSPVRRTRAP